MTFEFDPAKSASNKEKHGIDFLEAQSLWTDHWGIEIKARTTREERKLLIASYRGTVWTTVFTHRDKAVRIISVRKSRENGKEIYFSGGI